MDIKLSPSSLNLFVDCPRCFWMYKVKKIKRPDAPFPSLPSGMDKVLKEHFDTHRAKGTLPKVIDGLLSGILFPDLQKLDEWRSNRQGLRYRDEATGITLMGALDDLFLSSDGLYAPLDFKTRGYPLKEDTHEHYQNQMDLYAFLLEKNGLKPAGFAVLLFYHPKKVTDSHNVEFNAEPVRIKTSTENASKLFTEACGVLQGGEPEPSKGCTFCNWRGR